MGKINLKEMIESVLADLTSNAPIDNFIYKLRMIATYLKNDIFSHFVNKEFFNGYSIGDKIPRYRSISSNIKYKGIMYMDDYNDSPYSIIGNYDLTKVEIRESIPKIIDFSNSGKNLTCSLTEEDKMHIRYNMNVYIYKEISVTDIMSIPREVKTCLLDLIVQLNDDVFGDDIDFNVMNKKDEIGKIVTNNIYTGIYAEGISHISGGNIVGGQGNNVTINSETKNEILDILKKIEDLATEVDEDREDIADAIITIREELDNKMCRPKFLKTAFNGLKGLGVGVVKEQMSDYVSKALESIVKL